MTDPTIWVADGRIFLLGEGEDAIGPLTLMDADGADIGATLPRGTYNRDGGPGLTHSRDDE